LQGCAFRRALIVLIFGLYGNGIMLGFDLRARGQGEGRGFLPVLACIESGRFARRVCQPAPGTVTLGRSYQG